MSSTPHDSLVRWCFGQPEHAAGLLRSLLPEEIALKLRWPELKLESGSYVDPGLRASQSDLLYRVPMLTEGKDLCLYVLFEHQSTPDRLLAFRLLRYQVRIWDRFAAEHPGELLPPIVPLVLYHGKKAWPYSVEFAELMSVGSLGRESLHSICPRQRFQLIDLTAWKDWDLQLLTTTALTRLVLISLKHARHSENLGERLEAAAEMFREILQAPQGLGALARVVRYILLVSDHATPHELRGLLARHVNQRAGEVAMSVGERLIAKGREEGREEGALEGQRDLLLRQICQRFGDLAEGDRQRVLQADQSTLFRWTDRILTATSLGDLFGD
jgi:predicted transposase/invertase (TIGR01784 family)